MVLLVKEAGLDLIRRFETCRLKAYLCPSKIWTIGWGHTRDVREGDSCTQEQADAWLSEDVEEAEHAVLQAIEVPVTDNQFAALVSFTYNVGVAAFMRSNLLKKLNRGEDPSEEFLKWVYGKGRVLPGLVKRREAERDLFRLADSPGTVA